MAIDGVIKVLSNRKLLLADGNPRPRGEMARYLRSIGMEVSEAGSVPEALEVIGRDSPQIVAVDMDLPGDIGRCIAVAAERKLGEASYVMVTCRATTPKQRLMGVLSPLVGAVVLTPCRPEMMMERLARLLGNAEGQGGAAGAEKGVSVVEGNNSLLMQNAVCPFHERETRTKRYALRMNRLEVGSNFFDVPTYLKSVRGADFVDYHNLCVTVCPDCLFASADPAHFTLPHDRRHVTRPLTPTARYAIASRAHQRRELVGDLPESFYNEHRSGEEAIKSLELAVHCSATLHGCARHMFTDELVRQGNYHLRIAHMQEQLGLDQAGRDQHIEKASELLTEAFPTLPENGVPRNVYQVVATNIYLGNDAQAHQYLGHLARLSKQSGGTHPAAKATLDSYLHRSARAWESREEHRRALTPLSPTIMAPFLTEAA